MNGRKKLLINWKDAEDKKKLQLKQEKDEFKKRMKIFDHSRKKIDGIPVVAVKQLQKKTNLIEAAKAEQKSWFQKMEKAQKRRTGEWK